MATKMIGFRLSGEHLEKAQEILGNDITGINKKAQELMIAFLAGKITITESNQESKPESVPPDLINDLTDKIRELQDQINQIQQNNKKTTNRINDLENRITTANTANSASTLDIASNTDDQDTTNSNTNLTANTANSASTLDIASNTDDQDTTNSNTNLTANTANSDNTSVISDTANTANTANSEKHYRQKLLQRLGLSTKASKNQIIPKLKKLGVIVDPNSENFYQDSLNRLDDQ